MDNNVIKLSGANFRQICRICCEQNDLKNIFQSKYRNVTFANILENYVRLKISDDDGLSPYICFKCIKSLLILNAFLEQYKNTNETLRNYLYKNNNRPCNKYTQINIPITPEHEKLLIHCNFVDFNHTNRLVPTNVNKRQQHVTCAICNRTYTRKYLLRRHLSVTHRCATCSSLSKHSKMHGAVRNGRRRLCTVCGACVRHNFSAHMRAHAQRRRTVFRCEVCPFETTHWTSLYRHGRTHREKPFLCNTCGKDFSGKEFFAKHMRLHEPFDRPTPCYVCAAIFTNDYDYGKHLSTHTYYVRKLTNFDEYSKRKQKYKKRTATKKDEEGGVGAVAPKKVADPRRRKVKTEFRCEPCNKTFKDNAHLRIHVTAIHENRRLHKCAYCGKGFNLAHALREHVRTHTGETLQCDYCERTFKQNSTRYKHLREVHNIYLGQIRKEKSKERREKNDIRKAYKKLKMNIFDDTGKSITVN